MDPMLVFIIYIKTSKPLKSENGVKLFFRRKVKSWFKMPERILDVTSVTKRFQTTVPKNVREILNVSNEDRIIWIYENGEIKVRKS